MKKEKLIMQKIFKRTAAAIMAAASLAVTMIGTSASAVEYPRTGSMVLRNMPGAPGNVTSGKFTIESKEGASNYTTSYDFVHRTDAVLTVSTVYAITNKSVTLNKNNRSVQIKYIEPRYNYIVFKGDLTNSEGESGIWSVS